MSKLSVVLPGYGRAAAYVNPTPVPVTLGGVEIGTTFDGTVQDVLDLLLYPFIAPTFSAFSFAQTSPLEVGDTVAAGSKTFTWTTISPTAITADSVSIDDVTGAANLLTGSGNDGTEAIVIGAVTKVTAANHVWRITALDTQAQPFTRDFTVAWQWRVYYGESANASLVEAEIEALRVNTLKANRLGQYDFQGGGYKYIAFPTTFGPAQAFLDPVSGFLVAMEAPVTVSLTNSFGVAQDYYVYRTTNTLGGIISAVVS